VLEHQQDVETSQCESGGERPPSPMGAAAAAAAAQARVLVVQLGSITPQGAVVHIWSH